MRGSLYERAVARPLDRIGIRDPSGLVWAGGIALVALFIAAAILVRPSIAAGLVVGGAVVTTAVVLPARFKRAYLALGGVVMVGYAMLGRGFAYVGYEPLFIGEVFLALGLVTILVCGRGLGRALRSPVPWLVMAYMAWGLWRTVPYLGLHGADALRDAVLWGYGAFVVIAATVLLETGAWRRIPRAYARWVPWLVIWLPFGYTFSEIYDSYLPRLPGSGVMIPQLKPGDVAVHLAGLGVFMVLGLHRLHEDDRRSWSEWVFWLFWVAGFVITATQNRGGMVAAVVALGLVMVLRPSWHWFKILLAGFTLIGVLVAFDARFEIHGRREVSARQLAVNAFSVIGVDAAGLNPIGSSEGQNLSGTVDWRKQWWGDILGYTVHGPYFWTGKGFGVNLANSDGYQVEEDSSLRSPHNGHLTVLARAGVPGFALWWLVHGTFGLMLLFAYLKAKREGRDGWARIDLWILAYWSAFMVNGAFDVFLEGPQGGIWFWSLMGVGVAMLEAQRREGVS